MLTKDEENRIRETLARAGEPSTTPETFYAQLAAGAGKLWIGFTPEIEKAAVARWTDEKHGRTVFQLGANAFAYSGNQGNVLEFIEADSIEGALFQVNEAHDFGYETGETFKDFGVKPPAMPLPAPCPGGEPAEGDFFSDGEEEGEEYDPRRPDPEGTQDLDTDDPRRFNPHDLGLQPDAEDDEEEVLEADGEGEKKSLAM